MPDIPLPIMSSHGCPVSDLHRFYIPQITARLGSSLPAWKLPTTDDEKGCLDSSGFRCSAHAMFK